MADIRQAFLMISVAQNDRNFLRFLWVKNIRSEIPEIIVRRFRRIVFGLNASPFLLNATLRMHLQKFDDFEIPKIIRGFYVDDFDSGAWTFQSARNLFSKVRKYLLQGGFQLSKFHSNDALLETEVNASLGEHGGRVQEQGILEDKVSYAQTSLGPPTDTDVKVLGVGWDKSADEFYFQFCETASQLRDCKLTKRNLLSVTTRFFDPLGLLCPALVTLKLIFQDLCRSNIEWDEEVAKEVKDRVKQWATDAAGVPPVRFPRCALPKSTVEWVDIVGFSDASCKAYGACVYLRTCLAGEIAVNLLTAKSRVAPIRSISVPRLELLGNVVLAKLATSVLEAIKLDVPIRHVTLFTDSTTCLWWINNNSNEYNQYVHNRINEISGLFSTSKWRYVPTNINPADILSRPISLSKVVGSDLWRHGPAFLRQDETTWPTWDAVVAPIDADRERKRHTNIKTTATCALSSVAHASVCDIFSLFDLRRFRDSDKLFSVTAIVLKFIARIRRRCANAIISTTDVMDAQTLWLRTMQALDASTNTARYEKTKANLKLVADERAVLRCRGRLQHSSLEFGQQFPVYVPADSPLAKLLIATAHSRVRHAGVEQTLTQLRTSYWIPRGRQAVRRFLSSCSMCRRIARHPYDPPVSAPLPPFRVTGSLAFENIGVDFAGPLWCYDIFERSKMHKCYILLVTCALSRAVHLELTPNAGAAALVRALGRVFSRRGDPALCFSDNAKCFTSNELNMLVKQRRINWRYRLEKSPWWNGFTERLVGSTKRVLRRVLGRARLNFEELTTILVEAEGIINSRPLTYLPSDELDEPLTPAHLVLGKRLLAQDYRNDLPICDDPVSTFVARNAYVRTVLNHFWSRWRDEYLVQLREQHRLISSNGIEPHINDVVLVHDEKQPKSKWKMGRVIELVRGSDSAIRGALVRLAGGSTVRRPCQLLYPVERYSREVSSEPAPAVDTTERRRPHREAAVSGQLVRRLTGQT